MSCIQQHTVTFKKIVPPESDGRQGSAAFEGVVSDGLDVPKHITYYAQREIQLQSRISHPPKLMVVKLVEP